MRRNRHTFTRRLAALVLLVAAATAALGVLDPAPAAASTVWGCGSTPLGSAGTPSSISINASFPKTDGTTGTTSLFTLTTSPFTGSVDTTPGLDVDGDGTNDYTMSFGFSGGYYLYYTDTSTWPWTYHYRQLAVYTAGQFSEIFDLLNAYRGIDYSSRVTTSTTVFMGPYYDASFAMQTYTFKLYETGTGVAMPEGAVDVSVSVATAAGNTDITASFDTTGTSGTAEAWPYGISAQVFLDSDYKNLAALGLQAYDETLAVVPWSNLAVGVDIASLGGNTTDLAIEAGYGGEYAESGGSPTSVGFPGSAAVVAEQDCGRNAYDDVLVAYDDTLTGTAHPDADVLLRSREDADGDGTLDTTAMFFDGTITGLSKAVDVNFWAHERDIDGDGVVDDADYNGDGLQDMPWSGISLAHQGDAQMGIDATYGSQKTDSTDDMSMRISAAALQANPDVVFDYFGPVIEVDSDADGTGDDVDGDGFVDLTNDIQQARVRMCEVLFTSDTCSAGTETISGDIEVTYTNEVATDGDGNVSVSFPVLGAAPQQLVDTKAGHVDPENPDNWFRYESKESSGIRDISGKITGFRQGAFHFLTESGDTTADARITLDTTGLGELGLEALTHAADGSETAIWGFVHDVPDTSDITMDLDGSDVDGDNIGAELHGSSRTAVGFEANSDSLEGDQNHTIISGWLGTNDGTTDGLPTDVDITADVTGDKEVVVKNSSSVAALVGLTTSDAADRAIGMRTRANVSATIPKRFEAYVAEDMRRVELDTCSLLTLPGPIVPPVPPVPPGPVPPPAGPVPPPPEGAPVPPPPAGAPPLTQPVDGVPGPSGTVTAPAPVPPPAPALAPAPAPVLPIVPILPVLVPTCTPVTDLVGTVTFDEGDPEEAALPGVAMLPIPDPKADVFENPAGTDFESLAEYVHYVGYDEQSEVNPPEQHQPWATEFALHEMTRTGYTTGSDGLFRETNVCTTAETDPAHSRFGLGVYRDSNSTEEESIWADAALQFNSPTHTLDIQGQIDIPDESQGEIGALSSAQLMAAPANPLFEEVRLPCPNFGNTHSVDVAPLGSTAGGGDQIPPDLDLRLRNGSYDEVHNTIEELEDPVVDLPAAGEYGINAALYSSETHAAADVAGRITFPSWMELAQPIATTCTPEGNQDLASCLGSLGSPAFDQEYTTKVDIGLRSNGGNFGDLEAEVLLDTDDTLDGGPVMRIDGRLDTIPTNFDADITMEQRPRDNYVDVDLGVRDASGAPLQPVTVEVFDEAHPARFGDPDEGLDPMNEGQPNYRVYLHDLTDTIEVAGHIFTPKYGADLVPYQGGDECSGTFGKPENDDHIVPNGDDPRDWTSQGPRAGDTDDPADSDYLRPLYVDADISMQNSADTIDLMLDSRVDHARDHRGYDNIRNGTKLAYDSGGEPTDVELWALYPGVQANMETDAEFWGIEIGELEVCADLDIPLHATLSDTSRVSVGLDNVALTLSMDEAERAAGANATVKFEERFWDVGGGWAALSTSEGIWVEELMTYTSALFDEYANNVHDERMDVSMAGADTAGTLIMTGIVTSTWNELNSDWIDDIMGLGPWPVRGPDAAGDDNYIGAFALIPFHPDIIEEVQDDFGDWFRFNDAMDAGTDYLANVDCGSGDCGGFVDGPKDYWELPVLDRGAAKNETPPALLTGASACSAFGSTASTVESGNFARLPDGTELELDMRSAGSAGDGGRAEVYLKGFYSDGQVRFVQELFDFDDSTDVNLWCWQWRVDVNSLSVSDQGTITLDYDVEMRHRIWIGWWGSWTNQASDTVIIDPSGNMGSDDGALTASATSVSAGSAITFSTGDAEDAHDSCSFHPGDGTRVDQGDETVDAADRWDSGELAWEHTYDVPGTYDAIVFCHDEQTTVGPGTAGQHDPLVSVARTVTITVT